MKRALLTGGAGFIGSHLTTRLLGEDWGVTAVDNFDPFYERWRKLENIRRPLRHPNYRLVEADIRDRTQLELELDGGYDAIVHLAAKAGVRQSIADPDTYHEVNVEGMQNLLDLARTWGVKQFVFASSSSVYGINPRVPWKESDPVLMPISPYARTKARGELLGRMYSHFYGIRFVALRLFTVYGPRQRPDLAIHKFAERMLNGESISMYGDGSTRRDYTFIGDIVDGFRAAIDYHGSNFEVLNLSNERTVSLMTLIRCLENALGMPARIERLPEQAGDVPQTWGDIGKARRMLGYAPRTSIEEGLRQFAGWLAEARSPALQR